MALSGWAGRLSWFNDQQGRRAGSAGWLVNRYIIGRLLNVMGGALM